MKTNIELGKYRHYKNNNLYEVIGSALHSETLEEMVIYKSLYAYEPYGNEQLWVRPKAMFFEIINHNGDSIPRFEKIK